MNIHKYVVFVILPVLEIVITAESLIARLRTDELYDRKVYIKIYMLVYGALRYQLSTEQSLVREIACS